jgi:hypothetical protein
MAKIQFTPGTVQDALMEAVQSEEEPFVFFDHVKDVQSLRDAQYLTDDKGFELVMDNGQKFIVRIQEHHR